MYSHDLDVMSSNPSGVELGCIVLLSNVVLERIIKHLLAKNHRQNIFTTTVLYIALCAFPNLQIQCIPLVRKC